MGAFTISFDAYGKAHRLIWRGGLWRYLLLPLLMSLIYIPLALAVCGMLAWGTWSLVGGWLESWGAAGTWISVIVGIVALMVFIAFVLLTFQAVVMVFYSIFYDRILDRVEEKVLGAKVEAESGIFRMVLRVSFVTIAVLAISLVLLVLNLIFSFIPVVGWIGVAIVVGLQFFIVGFEYMDPSLDRRGYSTGRSLRTALGRFCMLTTFGSISSMILLVPILGWFVGPTYSVVAGAIIGIDVDKKVKERAEKRQQKRAATASSGVAGESVPSDTA